MRTRVKADKASVMVAIATMTLVTLVVLATPAFAHHPSVFHGYTYGEAMVGRE